MSNIVYKTDSLIITTPSNKADSDILAHELSLLGLRMELKSVKGEEKILSTIQESQDIYSSILILLNSKTINCLLSKDIEIKAYDQKIIFIFFMTQKSEREKVKISEENTYVSKSRSFESLAIDILRDVLSDEKKIITFQPNNSVKQIWKTPLYIFKKIEGFDDERKILVDVTWSSKPTKPEIAESLQSALREAFRVIGKKKCEILDFGAGKLRHTVFLLEKGHSVMAVDYESIFVRPSPQVQGYLDRASNYSSFKKIVYPSQFLEHKKKYDLILLVNVLGIMPEPLERLFVLENFNRILKKNGYIFLFNQHGDATQIKAASDKITDGGCTVNNGRKTFYKDYNTQEELFQIFYSAGLEVYEEANFKPSNNHTFLFYKKRNPILKIEEVIENKRSVSAREIFVGDKESGIGIADVIDSDKCLRFGEILFHSLSHITAGGEDAYSYEHIMLLMIRYVFQSCFKTPILESQYILDEGRKKIDIKANWRTSSSLKEIVISDNSLKSSFVPIECKNYTIPLKNPEYAQLIDRCSKRSRHFGIILCRKTEDRIDVLRHCANRWQEHDYLIIVLTDSDLESLLAFRDREDHDAIATYIGKKIEEVRDRSY